MTDDELIVKVTEKPRLASMLAALLSSASDLRDELLPLQGADLPEVQSKLAGGASLAVEVLFPVHGIWRVALVLIALDGKRTELAASERTGGGLN